MVVQLREYELALGSLNTALKLPKDDIVRDACIQRFEFSVELAWKTAKKVLGLSASSPRIVIRDMAAQGLIEDPHQWFSFIEARNLAAHVYNEAMADKVYLKAHEFYQEGMKLLSELKKI